MNTTSNGSSSSYVDPPILGCTSVVAQDPKGNVFHGRTLDWNVPNELRNASFMVRTCDVATVKHNFWQG